MSCKDENQFERCQRGDFLVEVHEPVLNRGSRTVLNRPEP